MQDKIQTFKQQVIEASVNENFVHHKWFAQYHLDIVERIAVELLEHYPQADADLVMVMVWLHDYGKILDFDNQYRMTLTAGRDKLTEIGFDPEFVERAINNIETLDRKLEVDLNQASIEVQIVSSADGCSHLVGPFMYIVWNEATDKSFVGKSLQQLMDSITKKATKDWDRKITLPEARAAFEARHNFILEQAGNFPEKFL